MKTIRYFFVIFFLLFISMAFSAPHELPAGTKAWGGAGGWKSDINKIFKYFSATGGEPETNPTIIGPLVIIDGAITAQEYNSSAIDGERGIILPENTTKSPGAGLEEIYNEGGLLKYSENGVEKSFVTIDDTAGDGDINVTLSADKIVEYIAAGGSGVPDGTSTDDILSWDGDSWEPIALTDHPAFASLLTAFNNAGLNSFTFTPSVTYPIYTNDATPTIAVDVTDTSTTYAVDEVNYKLDSGEYAAMTNTAGDTWSVTLPTQTDGAYDLRFNAADDKSTPNTGESSVYTDALIVDLTAPVIVADADSTHDGTSTFVATCTLTETNPANPAVTFTATGCTPTSGSCTGTYPDYVTPDLTPTGTDDVVVTFAATDLAGNAATGTDLVQEFAYSAGGTACSGIVGEQTAYTTSSSGANAYQHITKFDLGCNGPPTSINATVGAGEFKLSVYDSGFNLLYATVTQFNETNSSAHTITDTGVSTLDFTGQEYIYLGITASLGSTSYRADEYGSVIGYSFNDGTSGTVAPTPIEDWPVDTDTEYSRRRTVWLDFD